MNQRYHLLHLDPSFALSHYPRCIQDDKYKYNYYIYCHSERCAHALRVVSEESHEPALSFITFRSFIRAVTLPTLHSGWQIQLLYLLSFWTVKRRPCGKRVKNLMGQR